MTKNQDLTLDPELSPLLLFGCHNYLTVPLDVPDKADKRSDEADKRALFFYSTSRKVLLGKRVDDLQDHMYWTTPQGWLLVVHPSSRLAFLWNPFTLQRIALPDPDPEEFLVARCLLSHQPIDPNCVVLVADLRHRGVFWYCRPGGVEWFEHRYEPEGLGTSVLTAVRGRFYTIEGNDTVVTLEFSPDPTFTKTHVYMPVDPVYRSCDRCLLESCGELFSLALYHSALFCGQVVQVAVHKLDLSTRAWVKMDKIGDRVFFTDMVNFGASLSVEKTGLERNCIYFTRFGDKGLYVYNMERGTTTMHNPGPDLPDDATAVILMPAS